jgi:glycyl-tRNA synthetase beta chain
MVDSVLDAGFDDPALVVARLEAVKAFEADERFRILLTAFKRAYNITKGEVSGAVADGLLADEAEVDLYRRYQAIRAGFDARIREKRFGEAMNLLLELAVPIDVFFTKVMVMVDDENLRRNRLNLLGGITRRFLEIANFSKMESPS